MARLRMGMIGGGPGSFIGPVHRIAAELDHECVLVAGAFSSDAARSRQAGAIYGIDPGRAYASVEAMLQGESRRADGMEFAVIVTPNHLHLPVARAALEAGIAVLSDKPATATFEEARTLSSIVSRCGRPYALTYTYSGYPLVREARARVRAGALGVVRKVIVEYSQGWLAGEARGKQAEWRLDPARAGTGGCIADIGVHAFHLAEFVTGLRVTRLMADLGTVVRGRPLDDDCTVLLRFENQARGVLIGSQVSAGEMNGLRLRVYGEKGGLDWSQEQPNTLVLHSDDGRTELVRAGSELLGTEARAVTRLPGGHPEGYLEAFANLYRDFAGVMRGEVRPLLPDIREGLRGMAFVATAVEASRDGRAWVDLKDCGVA